MFSLHEGNDLLGRVVVDAAQPDPPEPTGLQQFHRDHHQFLVRAVLAPLALVLGHRRASVADGQVGLVDLDHALEPLAVGADHGAAEPMQHRPGRLVAAQPEHPLQPQGADAVLLVGQIPGPG